MQERTRIAGADRHGSVIEIHDVAVAVGIGRIEQGKLLHAHGILELGKVAGEAHFPELFEHARAVERGDRADEPGGSGSRCRLLHARMPRRIWSGSYIFEIVQCKRSFEGQRVVVVRE